MRGVTDAAQIEAWLVAELAKRLKIPPETIDPRAPLSRYDLDSLEAVSLVAQLDAWLDRRLEPTLLWRFPTIADLARHLVEPGAS